MPLSGWEGNTFFYIDASCQKTWAVDVPCFFAVTHLTLYLIIISFAVAHLSSSQAMFALSTNLRYLSRFG